MQNKTMENQKHAKYNFILYKPQIKHDDWKVVDDKVIVYFKVKDPVKKIVGWLYKKAPTCDITFDELCSKAWLYIDGEKTIYDIAKLMAKDCNESVESSIKRIVPYMKFVAQKGWIKFIN